MVIPVILVHGGAWGVPDEWVEKSLHGVQVASSTGYDILSRGGSAVDAVEAAVRSMEEDEIFNAGKGGSLNIGGKISLESSIQRGSDLEAGCVTLLDDVLNPVSLARIVMENTPHAFIGGEGAKQLAWKYGLDIPNPETLITDATKDELQDFIKNNGSMFRQDTVGAVVVDKQGHVAAATSTGGTVGKYVGRIGDAPQIGSGTYADDLVGAVSSTGHGESILKCCLAHSIIKSMESGISTNYATMKAVEGMMTRVNGTGGAIAVSNRGDVGIHFTTSRMSWCYIKSGEIHYGIERNQHEVAKYVSIY